MFLIELPWKREKLTEVWNWPHIFFINISGLWAEEASTEKLRRFFSYWRVFSIFFLIVAETLLIVAIIEAFTTGDVAHNLFAVFLLQPTAVGVYKTIQVTKHRKSFKLAMDLLDELTYEATSPEDMAMIRSKFRTMWIVFSVNLSLVLATVLHYGVRPLLILATSGKRTRILHGWPDFTETFTQFTISYIYDLISLVFLAFGWTLFENIFFCISECTLCQISVLKRNFEKLHLSGSPQETIHLKKILKFHKKILRICKALKTASDSILIVQTITTVLLFCSGLYIITNLREEIDVLINTYESMVLALIFLYYTSWYSNEIAFQCQEVSTSAYMSDWVDGSQEQKKTILIIMTRTKQLITFGGFLELNLNTFINVMKTSFSYYNFLRAVMDT